MPLLVAALAVMPSCGKQKFQKQTLESNAVAGQYSVTKPKIDIVVFQDNSDSVMFGPIETLKPQMNSFLNNLGTKWDYNFTVFPLLNSNVNSTLNMAVMPINQKYVVSSDCTKISGVMGCLNASQASTFNNANGDAGWIRSTNSRVGSSDNGFRTIQNTMAQTGMAASGFLRPDAALAIIVMSNGNDIEGMTFFDNGGSGNPQPDPNSGIGTLNYYQSVFAAYKGNYALSRFFSVVSSSSSCYSRAAFDGYRYRQMSAMLSSESYDLCSGGLSYTLSSITAQLQTVIEAFVFNYAVVSAEKPLVSSIVVKKNGVVIPQSSSNGWTYVGYLSNQPMSYSPTLGNNRSGYMIKLNGTAEYKGSDVITISYERE